MNLEILPQINNLEFAKKNHEIHGIINGYQLSRLIDIIVLNIADSPINVDKNVVNKITYQLNGKLHETALEAAQWGLELILKGQLNLKCQRCLNAMPYDIDINAQFIVLPNMKSGSHGFEFDGDALGEYRDDSDFETIPADEHMQVLDLIEDELLLTLPLAPMHTKEQHVAGLCVELSSINEIGKLNPFEVLKSLKK